MISPAIKDVIDIAGALGTPIAIIGGLYGFWRWSIKAGITGHDRAQEAKKALQQIDTMATNCFPTMQKALTELNSKTTDGNETLSNIDKGIAILVDRDRKI